MIDRRGRFDSLARQLLRRALDVHTPKEIARRVGYTPAGIRSLANGMHMEPRVRCAIRLAVHYSVPVEAWITPPDEEGKNSFARSTQSEPEERKT